MLHIHITATATDTAGRTQDVLVRVPVYWYGWERGGPIKGTCELGAFDFEPVDGFDPFEPRHEED